MRIKIRPSKEVKSPKKSILVKKQRIKHSNTYGAMELASSLSSATKKSVKFADYINNSNLCTVHSYEQIQVVSESVPKSKSSCACLIF